MRDYSIAVVIPAYNAELYIGDALDNVIAQTRLPEQIIVVDDGSIDRTAERVLSWKRENFPGLILRQQNNRGVSAARNTGACHAKADLIAFLDADDLFLPHHLARLELAFKRHPELLVCFGDASYFDAQKIIRTSSLVGTRIEDVKCHEQEDGLRLMKGSVYMSLLRGNYVSMSASLVSKSALERVGLFDETIRNAEDRDLFLRLSLIGPFAYYPCIVAQKRLHENNLTHSRPVMLSMRYQFLVLQKMLDRTKKLGLSAKERTKTKEAMNEHVRNMLAAASNEGVTPYLKTCAYLMRQRKILQVILQVFNPAHLLRMLRSLIRRRTFGNAIGAEPDF